MSGSGFVLGSGRKFALHLRQTDGKTHSECDAESCQRRILWHPALCAQNASCAHEARTRLALQRLAVLTHSSGSVHCAACAEAGLCLLEGHGCFRRESISAAAFGQDVVRP